MTGPAGGLIGGTAGLFLQTTATDWRLAVQDPNEEGATAVEYGLMASLIAVVIAGAVTAFGIGVNGLFQSLIGVWP